MQLFLLNSDFGTLGLVSVFESLIWTRRYYEPGTFELHLDLQYRDLMADAKYLYRNDRTELGIIQQMKFTQSEDGTENLFIKGYFAEKMLDHRVIELPEKMSGTPEEISRSLVDKYFINPTDTDRTVDYIQLGELMGSGYVTKATTSSPTASNVLPVTVGENLIYAEGYDPGASIKTQKTGVQIGSFMYDLQKTQEMSHRLRFDYENNILYFEVWQGKDRTDAQTTNSWAVFSNDFHNVKSMEYMDDRSEEKNYVYVAGEGEGSSRKVVEIDLRESTDEERKELYVDARDLQSTDETGAQIYTDEEYEELLRQRGLEKVESYKAQTTLDGDIDPTANLIYREDFDLGDICTYKNTELGILKDARITEIIEVYEGVETNISVKFGDGGVTSIKKLIQREAE